MKLAFALAALALSATQANARGRDLGIPFEGKRGPLNAITDIPGVDVGQATLIIIVVGTDAPLMPLQLQRVAKRAALGLARLGSYSGTSSGDIILAFSTVPDAVNGPDQKAPSPITPLADSEVKAVFEATVQATEEAIVNALVAARMSTGADGYTMYSLPHDETRAILKRYNRLESSAK